METVCVCVFMCVYVCVCLRTHTHVCTYLCVCVCVCLLLSWSRIIQKGRFECKLCVYLCMHIRLMLYVWVVTAVQVGQGSSRKVALHGKYAEHEIIPRCMATEVFAYVCFGMHTYMHTYIHTHAHESTVWSICANVISGRRPSNHSTIRGYGLLLRALG